MLPSQNRDAHLFHVDKKQMICMIVNDLYDFMVSGFKVFGGHGTLHVLRLVERNILWSGTYLVPEVFRSPGNPIN